VKVYFGAGCFWHVQHEFVLEEVQALKRSGAGITAVSGYVGGTSEGDAGKVCYHNARQVADYGSLGHAEAVQLEIPESELPRFATKYFSLFGERGIRHDPQDRGGEYRSVLGLPGGEASPLYDVIQKAARESPGGMKLVRGVGNEPDTIGAKAVLVYDSNKFPFYSAEVYHQFHNDFMGPAYGKAYNDLQKTVLAAGGIQTTGCPENYFA
jgi:peptide methionine sulfoxide reductase MsrA